jgi:hypothetical protein
MKVPAGMNSDGSPAAYIPLKKKEAKNKRN